MKTPREILMERHRPMEPKLDALRRQILASEFERESAGSGQASWTESLFCGFLLALWQELVWPCRRIWCGLAAMWVVVVVLNLTTGEPSKTVLAQGPPPTPETLAVLKEQEQLMAQLLDGAAAATPPPRPRSEERGRISIG